MQLAAVTAIHIGENIDHGATLALGRKNDHIGQVHLIHQRHALRYSALLGHIAEVITDRIHISDDHMLAIGSDIHRRAVRKIDSIKTLNGSRINRLNRQTRADREQLGNNLIKALLVGARLHICPVGRAEH